MNILNKIYKLLTMKNETYDALVWVATIIIPALGWFYSSVAEIWTLPFGDQVSRTCLAFTTLLCAILKISNAQYRKSIDNKE